jgi:hypothetical protein
MFFPYSRRITELKWQRYWRSPEPNSVSEFPFLIMRVVSARDHRRNEFYVDAVVDTGAAMCHIPQGIVARCESKGIPLAEGKGKRVFGVHRKQAAHTPTYRFHTTICASPIRRNAYADDLELRRWFGKTKLLYVSTSPPRAASSSTSDVSLPGKELLLIERPYAVIGQDVLREWTLMLHGKTGMFRVSDGSLSDWIVCSPGPKLPLGLSRIG